MDKYDEMLDIGAKNVMGIDLDKREWTYDEAVNNYIVLLDYYGNEAPIEIFSNMENLARLNLSFNYCTGQVLVDYQKEFYSIDDMLEKVQFNEHYRNLLDVGNNIKNRLIIYNNNSVDITINHRCSILKKLTSSFRYNYNHLT